MDTKELEFVLIKDYQCTTLAFVAPDGRRVEVEFGGGNVVFSGDLPVEESAKMLFEAYGSLMPKCECDKGCMDEQ